MTEAENKIRRYLEAHPRVSIAAENDRPRPFGRWSDIVSGPRDIVTPQELADRVGVSVEDVRAHVRQAVSAWRKRQDTENSAE